MSGGRQRRWPVEVSGGCRVGVGWVSGGYWVGVDGGIDDYRPSTPLWADTAGDGYKSSVNAPVDSPSVNPVVLNSGGWMNCTGIGREVNAVNFDQKALPVLYQYHQSEIKYWHLPQLKTHTGILPACA